MDNVPFVSDTRETGFVNAITAAGVTFAVTRACTMGDLVECSCDKTAKGPRNTALRPVDSKLMSPVGDGDWEWGGCGDNVNFGYRKSKDFMDSRYRKRSDFKTLVKIHNNDAGRLVSFKSPWEADRYFTTFPQSFFKRSSV